jgi:hypothetical protein
MREGKRSEESIEEIAAHLIALERALLDPSVRRDRARVSALLADDFVEFGSSGRVWTRDAILDLLETEDYAPPAIEGFACRPLADGVVLVTYSTLRTDKQTGECTASLRSSIWSKESGGTGELGRWRLRFHQGTTIP